MRTVAVGAGAFGGSVEVTQGPVTGNPDLAAQGVEDGSSDHRDNGPERGGAI